MDGTMAAGCRVDHEEVNRTLAVLESRDPELAEQALAVWQGLTVLGKVPVIDQDRVQGFLWREVPEGLVRLWPKDDVDAAEVADAAAALFDELGLARYAEICRSPTTSEIHAAFGRSTKAGHAAAQRAEQRSGVLPPTLDDGFAFGYIPGTEELSVRLLVTRTLETAATSGQLAVGRTGWKTHQRALVRAVLDAPHPAFPTQSFRSTIITERLERWIDVARQHSPRLADLRERHATQLLQPRPRPTDITTRLAAFLWLLDTTARSDPPEHWPDNPLIRSLAAECYGRNWWGPEAKPPPDLPDDDVVPLSSYVLGLGHITGAIVTRNGRHVLTPAGRRLLADPVLTWDAFLDDLCQDDLFHQTVVETAILLLVDEPGGSLPAGRLFTQIAEMAEELGWRNVIADNEYGTTVQERLYGIDRWLFHSMHAGLLTIDDVQGPYLRLADDATITMTPAGHDALLTLVSRKATGPVTQILRS